MKKKLGISNPTPDDMLNLTKLNVNYVRNLSGLEHAKNVVNFTVNNWTPEMSLNISHISSMISLKILCLTNCGIEDISVLSSLNKLEVLNLSSNNISGSLSFLSPLINLKSLGLSRNRITDISALSSLKNLESLMLRTNRISDIAPLASLENLTHLLLEYNDITDITPLASLENLTGLSLGYNDITDITPLASLENLTGLTLEYNDISDISVLSSLVKLKTLSLSGNQKIRDMRPLSALINMFSLNLCSNGIEDVSFLSSLTNLVHLNLRNNQIRDISVLSSLKKLEDLSIRYNLIKDFSVISSLSQLETIDLKNNPWYFRQFLKIAISVIVILFVFGLAIHLYLNKTWPQRTKVCLLSKISLSCCIIAPFLCWFCFYFLGDALSWPTIYLLSTNMFISSFIHVSIVVSVLLVGIVSTAIAIKKIRKNNNHLEGLLLSIVSLFVLLIWVVLCGMEILTFVYNPYYHPKFQ
ncbi:MAG: leucine-rich repeat domain-containing protein [Phycisphaerae bacterium]|nr:leucine-rich repeat domain-containing protein [Phycisphaerae bacterium]